MAKAFSITKVVGGRTNASNENSSRFTLSGHRRFVTHSVAKGSQVLVAQDSLFRARHVGHGWTGIPSAYVRFKTESCQNERARLG
jgi:hypothetical protein